jgi:hypothetical protein
VTNLTSPEDSEGPEPTEEEAEMLREFAEAEGQLLAAPVEDVIANHCYGLFQLAALHLGQQPPHLPQSRLAIDALAAIVDGLGNRLGETTETLREGLGQIRLAYVQIAGAMATTNGANPPGTENPGTENPGTENPVTENPVTEEPATEEPATEEPAAEEPAAEEPDSAP